MNPLPCYLCLPDEQSAIAALAAAGLLTDDGPVMASATHELCIPTDGVLIRPGTYDADGNELTPPEPLSGYHINAIFRGPVPDALRPFQVKPAHPLITWALAES